MKKLLCSALFCATLAHASAPDHIATHATTAAWNPEDIENTKRDNADYALMSLTIWPLQQVCQILAENGHASAITSLGQVSIHLASRLLRRMGAYDNPSSRHAIRVQLWASINAHKENVVLIPWKDLLENNVSSQYHNASLQYLCWASDTLSPENLTKLRQDGLLGQLACRSSYLRSLALAANAAQFFKDRMNYYEEAMIIEAVLQSFSPVSSYSALRQACKEHLFTDRMRNYSYTHAIAAVFKSSLPLSEISTLGTASKHLFTEKMDDNQLGPLIKAALRSSCPLSDYAACAAACKQHLFMAEMSGLQQAWVVEAVLSLSKAQLAALVGECRIRMCDDADSRCKFILKRATDLRSEQ